MILRCLALLSVFTWVGCMIPGEEGAGPSPVGVQLLATSEPVPYSLNSSLALVRESQACIIESYELRIRCGSPEWLDAVDFGREGQGPGEFKQSPLWVLRGPSGSFGAYDAALGRMTVFPGDERHPFTVPLPFLFSPAAPFDSVIVGSYAVFQDPPPGALMAAVSVPGGDTLKIDTLLHPIEKGWQTAASSGLTQLARGPNGEMVAVTGGREIVIYDHEHRLRDHFRAPGYHPEFPNGRDIDAYRDGMREAFGSPPSESAIRHFKETAKAYTIPGRSIVFDGHGRYWVATQRNREDSSYFDVYEGSELVATVRIRDRLLAFDILGATLAALVERSSDNGIAIRAIDWYRIVQSSD